MGTKCFHDITIIESQQVTNKEKKQIESPIELDANLEKKESLRQKLSHSQRTIKSNNNRSNQKNISTKEPEKKEEAPLRERKVIKAKIVNEKNEMSEEYEKNVLTIIQKHNRANDDKELIENCLLKHFFMKDLETKARKEIIKEMSLASIKPNTYIFKEGGIGNYFYILKKGTVEVISNNNEKRLLNVGESFGELALLHGATRVTSTKAVTECLLWVMERKNFRKIVDHITKKNFEQNKNFIESIPILANIDHAQKALLCSNLYKESFEKGNFIVRKGDPAHCLYIVKEGEVDCSLDGKVVRTLVTGDNFGERSILVDSTRSLDCIAKTDCVCYSVTTSILKSMLGNNFRSLLYLNFIKSSFNRSKIFGKFNVHLLDKARDLFRAINLKKNDVAYKKGYVKCNKIVVVIDGNLINRTTNEVVANRGDILFENELFNEINEEIDFDIFPHPDCLLAEADTMKFFKILGGTFKQLMTQTSIIDTLQKVRIFRNLTVSKLEHLIEVIKEENFRNGENIMTQGEKGNKFYILKKGKVDIIVNDKYIRTLNEKEYFGERALFFHEKRSATIKANGDVTVLYISQSDFENVIEGNMKEHLMNRLYLQDESVELKDLYFVHNLGTGNYGNVSLVNDKKTKFYYAIKAISRKQIDNEQLHKNLNLERSILLQIDHPFIVKLVKSLKDDRFIYFLMEYIKGKELFDVIRDIGLLNKPQTQFYGGSLLVAVDYLHERKFIYRDIKPENVMVIANGYIKIIDFGTAKAIIDRTNTIIGTPHYMAPEVILGEGYSFQVDIWSIAVCMFEFMCGGVPYGENAEDPMDVYLAIINDKMEFPDFCDDKDFKNLMIQMLTKNPMTRMAKLSQVKSHIWFKDFNWEDLLMLNLNAPYKPIMKQDSFEGNDNIKFIDYVKDQSDEDEKNKDVKIDEKMKLEYDEWFRNF